MFAGAALILAAAGSPAPSPSPSPLKQIIEVRSRQFCTTLVQRVQPAIAGLLKNDELIEHGRGGLLRTGADSVAGSKAATMDKLGVRNVALAMTHNLAVIDGILDDPARFPKTPGSDDERAADAIKTQLLNIAARQQLVVNAMMGTVETTAMGAMKSDLPEGNPTAHAQTTNPTAISGPGAPAGDLSTGLEDPHTLSVSALMNSDIAGTTIYDKLAALIARHQVVSQSVEATAADAIVTAAASCRGATPAP